MSVTTSLLFMTFVQVPDRPPPPHIYPMPATPIDLPTSPAAGPHASWSPDLSGAPNSANPYILWDALDDSQRYKPPGGVCVNA